jgi:hypothetical protein
MLCFVGLVVACAIAFVAFYRCRTAFGVMWRWHWYDRSFPNLSGAEDEEQVSGPEGEGGDESHTA